MGTSTTSTTSNMLAKIVTLVALVAVSNAAPEKRQLPTCTNAFTLTTNPCTRGGRTYFPVPGDNKKFVQCDILGGAYVVQCPTGQLYNPTLNACQTPQIATPAPQRPTPALPRPSMVAPSTLHTPGTTPSSTSVQVLVS